MLKTPPLSAGCNDRPDLLRTEEVQRSGAVPPSLPTTSSQEHLPDAVPVKKRSVTPLVTATTPVILPSLPNLGNTCFVNASMQYLASFINEKTLTELLGTKPPRLPDCLPSGSIRDRLRIEAWFKAKESFCTLISRLNTPLRTRLITMDKQDVETFLKLVSSYTLLSKSRFSELFFRNHVRLFEIMGTLDTLKPEVTLDQLIQMLKSKLDQQDAMEFTLCIKEMFSLDNLSSLKETTRFTYKKTLGVHLEEGVCISMPTKQENDYDLFFNLALPSNIHESGSEGDIGYVIAATLNNDFRAQRIDKDVAEQAYLKAGKQLPATYDETLDRNCHITTSLSVPTFFETLLVTLGVFEYDYQTRSNKKRSDEAATLIARSNGVVSLAGFLEYEELLEDADERTSHYPAKNVGEIIAILCHKGMTPNFGHYMTLRKINGTWYVFDDVREHCITVESSLMRQTGILGSIEMFKGFEGVAYFLHNFATPYAIAIGIKPLSLSPEEIERSRSSTLESMPASKKIKISDGDSSLPDNDHDSDDCFITGAELPPEVSSDNMKLDLSKRKRKHSN